MYDGVSKVVGAEVYGAKSMKIGDRIKAKRMSLGWSQQKLADVARVSQQTVAKLEIGSSRSTTKVGQLAKALGITADELLADPWESGELGQSLEHARVDEDDLVTPEQLGRIIREKRLSQKMTQSQLADRIGVTKGAISHWERGRVDGINPVNLHWLAQVLRLTDDELVLFAGRPKLSFPELPPFGQTDMELIHMYSRLHEDHRQTIRVIIQGLLKLQGEDDGCERFDGPLEEGDSIVQ